MPLFDLPDVESLRADGNIRGLIMAMREAETYQQAMDVLIELGESAIQPLVDALRVERDGFAASEMLRKIGPVAIAPLIQALEKKAGSGYAATILEDFGEPAVEPLIKVLGSEELRVRVLTVRALGVIGDKRAIPPIQAAYLEHMCADEDRVLADVIMVALERLGVESKFSDDSELSLEEYLRELEAIGFSKSKRSDRIYYLPAAPNVRFKYSKRIMGLERRDPLAKGKKSWIRVKSYSILKELGMAMKTAEALALSSKRSN